MAFVSLFLSLTLAFFSLAGEVKAEAQPILTWQAENYSAPGFLGKSFPTTKTKIGLSLTVINKKKFVDLDKADISWFLDGKLLVSGRGLKDASFSARVLPGGEHAVRAVADLPSGEEVETSLRVPVVRPEVSITKNFSGERAVFGKLLEFSMRPYFFNAPEDFLSYFWNMNDGVRKGRDRVFVIRVPAGEAGSITLRAAAQNPDNSAEVGTEVVDFTLF